MPYMQWKQVKLFWGVNIVQQIMIVVVSNNLWKTIWNSVSQSIKPIVAVKIPHAMWLFVKLFFDHLF